MLRPMFRVMRIQDLGDFLSEYLTQQRRNRLPHHVQTDANVSCLITRSIRHKSEPIVERLEPGSFSHRDTPVLFRVAKPTRSEEVSVRSDCERRAVPTEPGIRAPVIPLEKNRVQQARFSQSLYGRVLF